MDLLSSVFSLLNAIATLSGYSGSADLLSSFLVV